MRISSRGAAAVELRTKTRIVHPIEAAEEGPATGAAAAQMTVLFKLNGYTRGVDLVFHFDPFDSEFKPVLPFQKN